MPTRNRALLNHSKKETSVKSVAGVQIESTNYMEPLEENGLPAHSQSPCVFGAWRCMGLLTGMGLRRRLLLSEWFGSSHQWMGGIPWHP